MWVKAVALPLPAKRFTLFPSHFSIFGSKIFEVDEISLPALPLESFCSLVRPTPFPV